MSRARAQIKRMLLLLLACITPATMFGCAQLFKQEPIQTSYETDTPIAPRDTIQLDIAMADRPGEDSLLGLLWDDVDEIGVLDVSKKRLLNANGFRIGVAGSSVPSALQSMLRESAKREATEAAWEKDPTALPGSNQVTMFSGQDTLFEVSSFGSFGFTEVDDNGEPLGEESRFENARCVVRLTAEKMQDGWIKLTFLPEIHHGAKSNRPTVGEMGMEFKQSQRVEPLYKYQFDVTLNPGEIAIIGADSATEDRPGHRFLSANSPTGLIQKLITVRFVQTLSVAAQRQTKGIDP